MSPDRYARLAPGWLLRGWADLPHAVVRWGEPTPRALDPDTFYVLDSCDGETDFFSLAFLPQHRALLDRLESDGVVVGCRRGDGPDLRQRFRAAPNPLLRAVDWAITGDCNLRCRHCFMESPSRRFGSLSTRDLASLVDQIESANVLEITLTGGEPLLRADFDDLVALLAARMIWVSQVYTNGVLLRPHHLDALRSANLWPAFQVSFDGVGTHDAMRGAPGVEGPTLASIRMLVENGFPVVVATAIDVAGARGLGETYALMRELGVAGWRVSLPQHLGNWRASTTDLTLDEAAAACLPLLVRWEADGRPFDLQLGGFFRGTTRSPAEDAADVARLRFAPGDYDCRALRDRVNLLPDGTLVPCPGYVDAGLKVEMPNLITGPDLTAAWTASTLRAYTDLKVTDVLAANPVCAACEHLAECGTGCRPAALAETGHLLVPDPSTCALVRSGHRARFAEASASATGTTAAWARTPLPVLQHRAVHPGA